MLICLSRRRPWTFEWWRWRRRESNFVQYGLAMDDIGRLLFPRYPQRYPQFGLTNFSEQRVDPLVEHLERCAGGRQALYLGPVDEKKRRIGRGAQMAREREVGCSLGVRGAVLQALQHLSSVESLSGRDPADSGRLRKALPPLVEGLLKLAGPVDGFLRRQVAQGCKSSAGVQGVHYQPAFFKHSLVSLAEVRAREARDACVRFGNVRVGRDRPGALAGEKAATDGSERHAVAIGSLELDDASREAPAPTTIRVHHVHDAPRGQNGGLHDASAHHLLFIFPGRQHRRCSTPQRGLDAEGQQMTLAYSLEQISRQNPQ